MQNRMIPVIAMLALLFVMSFSLFIVKEWEKVALFQLGEIVNTDFKPGLHFKVPFITNVRKFDGRILTLDESPESYLTNEKKNVIVDSFAKWRISDVKTYYKTMRGSEALARSRLSQIIQDGLREKFGERSVKEVVSGERDTIMKIITEEARSKAKEFGIEVVDIRIKRIDLASEVSDSVYSRMEAERTRVAKELRAKGAEEAEKIRADADRQRTVLLAEAYKEAQKVKGAGDAQAAKIYAQAFSQDKEFYSFYRKMDAYRKTFAGEKNLMVLDPNSDYFSYFKDEQGRSSR
ncbi:MAG: protease modulator HflC [Gammaproteobacteria bacterium]|nr:MAG: protease modulator HflC [Gammaproteobacteria bacterium]